MADAPLIMALDQGTTSSRTIIFDASASPVALSQMEFPQIFPQDGWVEHNPDDLWSTILTTAKAAMQEAESSGIGNVSTIAITNQRETVLVWDRKTGEAVCNALVWQDRRTSARCRAMVEDGHEATVAAKTGLLLDPYFSASKLAWILENIEGVRARAEAGDLAFGTVDTYLIWKLTNGESHVTDETNASRTSLFNIHTGNWDDDLLELFNIPASLLPRVLKSADEFGQSDPSLFGRALPIQGVAGDQQAAAFGQSCTKPGMAKATYGTGCFVLMNTGTEALTSNNRLLTTRACRTGAEPIYALEGSIFIAGAVAQWLRDELRIISSSPESETIATAMDGNGGVYLVPAFTGLGAPHWDSEARGAIYGLTRNSGREEIVRAALESVAFQTRDLFKALRADGIDAGIVRVDGGMSANNWLMQFISDVAEVPLQRPQNIETTALGAAFLAGLQACIWNNEADVEKLAGTHDTFEPMMAAEHRDSLLRDWDIAVQTTRYRAQLQQRSV